MNNMKTNEAFEDEFGVELVVEVLEKTGLNDSGSDIVNVRVKEVIKKHIPDKYKNTQIEKAGDIITLDRGWLLEDE